MHYEKNGGGVDDERGDGGGWTEDGEPEPDLKPLTVVGSASFAGSAGNNGGCGVTTASGSEPCFKCHLCDSSYLERQSALDHIRINHAECYEILVSQGATDNDHEASAIKQDDVENRKVSKILFCFKNLFCRCGRTDVGWAIRGILRDSPGFSGNV